jgi:tRNA-dihydrouridine synthase B
MNTSWETMPTPLLALAPMQDVTDLPFWRLMAQYGGADVYFTEYFRVYAESRLDKHILASITQNPTGKPVIAQMIGNDIPSLIRIARELQKHPIAAIDLNLGCPAPVVYRKCAGGGLLRDLPRVDAILGALREAIPGKFTVKTRLGFDDERTIDVLLPIFQKHSLDLLTVHGRTVKQMYRDGVRYDLIARAAKAMNCPVLANGNVASAQGAQHILLETKVHGLMIGRGAVRNPWIFRQIRQQMRGEPVILPSGREVLDYIHALYDAVCSPDVTELQQVQKMKKYANFLGAGIDITGTFLHDIRRASRKDEFFAICARALDHDDPMPLEPFSSIPENTEASAC